MSLGTNINRLRMKCGMSQDALAEKLGVSRQSVSKWETDGAVPELEKLVRLAELFGVSLDELVRDIRPEEGSGRADNAVGSDGLNNFSGSDGLNGSVGSDGSGGLSGSDGLRAASAASKTGPNGPATTSASVPGKEGGMAPVPAIRKIVGVGLIWTGILLLFLALVLGGIGVFLVGLLPAVPLIGCGVICMVCRKRVGLWCGWMVFVPIDAYLQLFTSLGRGQALASLSLYLRNGILPSKLGILPSQLIVSWILVVVFVGLIALTLWSFRNLQLQRDPRTITLLAAGWVLRLVGLPAVVDLMARQLLEKMARSGWGTYGGIYSTISFVMGRIEDVLLVLLLVYTAAVLRKRIGKRE